MVLLLAILEKRAGLALGGVDVYLNVAGGLRVDEPAVDLAAVLAVVSSVREKPVKPGLVAFGEIGLSGEIRAVSSMQQRVAEAARLGFSRCLVPDQMGESTGNCSGFPPGSGLATGIIRTGQTH